MQLSRNIVNRPKSSD